MLDRVDRLPTLRRSARVKGTIWTDEDDLEVEYGTLHEFDRASLLEEEQRIRPAQVLREIWPSWHNGRPTQFRRRVGVAGFYNGRVRHKECWHRVSIELDWNDPHELTEIRRNYRLLPSTHQSHWSGVYRIFSMNAPINRSCGVDATGTLYVGRAGLHGRNWSILRNRIMSIVKGGHHTTERLRYNEAIARTFPWESLRVEWAYLGMRTTLQGKEEPVADLAETFLLATYRETYGEYPPLNEKG